ncbi:hypothetical protein IPZ58_16385 [Streptomyces roseoverticillatus]|uniref:hypothetical protein n=1 Tax=Streptomyces roseoverticillatus TaxID=66429 RepID=UPI001F3A9033|nr:hypothetical protein [Streptomyces roseoverticillatus]MCF3103150.1 hypothetical protein [Streptomyces roseoverticillatus]
MRAAGGRRRMVYLSVEKDELLRRLATRNESEDASALTVTTSALEDFFACFAAPADDEEAVVYTGDLDAVLAPTGFSAPTRTTRPRAIRRRGRR